MSALCWLCHRPLDIDTDGRGNTTEDCPRCRPQLAAMHKELEQLRAKIYKRRCEECTRPVPGRTRICAPCRLKAAEAQQRARAERLAAKERERQARKLAALERATNRHIAKAQRRGGRRSTGGVSAAMRARGARTREAVMQCRAAHPDWTQEQIGRHVGVTGARVNQIMIASGIYTRQRRSQAA